ncbi:MAG: hypothetical protein ACX932_05575, partial [Gammaproteobacteria bacterium]
WAILIVIIEKKCSWTQCPLRFFLNNNYQPPLKAVGFRTFKAGSELLHQRLITGSRKNAMNNMKEEQSL